MFPALSPDQACQLHRELLLWTCGSLLGSGLADVEVWLSEPSDDPAVEQCIALGIAAVRRQCGADLGERMHHAISDGLRRYRQVILVGSDCPAIDRTYLQAALAALARVELVVGPATDGGYVLLGARRIRPELFSGVAWGGCSVFAETVQRADRLGLDWQALPALQDIDRPEDLPAWEHLKQGPEGAI
jgi:rSAM/selenodomain-associated transferase 1